MSEGIRLNFRAILSKGILGKLDKKFGESIVTKALDAGALTLLARNRRRFLKGVDPEGAKWPASQAAKRRAKGLPDQQGIKRKGSDGNTLFSTGSLFFSLQAFKVGDSGDSREVGVNPDSINSVTGKNVGSYAVKHQSGVGVVQRKFLGISTDDQTVIEKVVQRQIQRALNK